VKCQEAIQNDLIPTDPSSMVSNPLSLKYLSGGQSKVRGENPFMHDSHNYENQASNILKMEKRYETPLK